MVASEAGKLADMADIRGGVVLRWRCPAGDDIPDAAQPVLGGVGAQEAEGGAEAPFHTHKVAKDSPSPHLPRGGGGERAFPEGLRVPDV